MAKMKIFIRRQKPWLPPDYNPTHSAHPPYLFSGRQKVDVIRWNPQGMMKDSALMYRKRGLMKRPYILWLDRIVIDIRDKFHGDGIYPLMNHRMIIAESHKLWEKHHA